MSEINYVVRLDGRENIAFFPTEGQAEFWAKTIAEQAANDPSRYSVRTYSSEAVEAYKDRVYEAAMRAANEPTCSAVQDFLDDIDIDRERYAEEATFTVVVKYDENLHGNLDVYEIERAIENGASFDHYGVEVSRA